MHTELENALLKENEGLREKVKYLEKLTLDELTGLLQLRVFKNFVKEEIRRCKRSGNKFSIFVIDLNCLKSVNDTHGHPAGDKMLSSFARLLKKSIRSCDIVARTGGDEFMVFLPDHNEDSALLAKSRLLEKIEDGKNFLHFFSGAAIGVATFVGQRQTFDDLYAIADEAMYEHKKAMKQRS